VALNRDSITLGLTGSFGSGCTTLGEALVNFNFKRISLSAGIKKACTEIRKQEGRLSETEASRRQLQDCGNKFRKTNELGYWAKDAVKEADALNLEGGAQIVFDGIRNCAEIEFFRTEFPNFYLIAVWCPHNHRWDRVKEKYRGNYAEFEEDDKRDADEDIEYGQQVQLCVDQADIVITNDKPHSPKQAAVSALKGKIKQYIDLITGASVRPPTREEMAMAIAYATSLRSQCLKRTVGAAITDRNGVLISTGYNENPEPMEPCIRQFEYCYKDARLKEHIHQMVEKKKECPFCKKTISNQSLVSDKYKCPHCAESLVRAYAPDRMMSRCTAIHAEQMALMNSMGRSLKDTILFTSTFPCLQCSRQIGYAGIKKVVYVEPYPDPDSHAFLTDFMGVSVLMFEGVKARAYQRVFNNVRRENERRYSLPT